MDLFHCFGSSTPLLWLIVILVKLQHALNSGQIFFFLYSLLDFGENKPLHFDLGIPVFNTEV